MEPNLEYRFIINAYTPATLPMARLAEYLADLAKLLGSKEGVHFLHLEPGSSVVAYKVDFDAAIAVTDRIAKCLSAITLSVCSGLWLGRC